MKFSKVSFTETYPIFMDGREVRWQKIFCEAELDETDDRRQSLYECKKTVESFFFESNKAAEKQEAIIKAEKDKRTPQDIIIESIEKCVSLDDLKTFEKLSSNNSVVKAMYDLQLKKLS